MAEARSHHSIYVGKWSMFALAMHHCCLLEDICLNEDTGSLHSVIQFKPFCEIYIIFKTIITESSIALRYKCSFCFYVTLRAYWRWANTSLSACFCSWNKRMENCWQHILKAVRYAGLKCTAHYREEPDNVSGIFSQWETLTIVIDIFCLKVSSTIVAEGNSPSLGLHVILMVDISLITLGSEKKQIYTGFIVK